MTIAVETDPSGRRVLVSVADDPHAGAALAELLTALRWTRTDEIIVDLSALRSVDMRVAVVLARAKRHHDEVGRKLSIVCPTTALAQAMRTVNLGPAEVVPRLEDTGWCEPCRPRLTRASTARRARPHVTSRLTTTRRPAPRVLAAASA